ncbi:MAG TPA: hypothetical protein DCF96_02350 [Rhodobacteraceae bacterium]|nr:hypothetical protein [Paracoccaceae bacterium]
MQDSLKQFSSFVSEVNDRARVSDAESLARWAVSDLSQKIGFDCAWYGWAQVKPEGVEIHANSTFNLPGEYYSNWCEISEHDLLAANILENPGKTATYDRYSGAQNEGMASLSDTFGLRKMATAMYSRPGRVASFYISGYRSGKMARALSLGELDFLQCSVDQLSSAMRLSAIEMDKNKHKNAVTIFVNKNGIGILGLQNLRDKFGDFWPDWDGNRLPKYLRKLINQPGEHVLVDHNLVVTCEAPPGLNEMGLRKFSLRPLTRFDMLTQREREVALVLSAGKSHKEAARLLGVAPATIRNQTQSIYSKLEVDNRSNLAAIVNGFA